MRLIDNIKDWDAGQWSFVLIVIVPALVLITMSLTCLGMAMFYSSVGKADYCYVAKGRPRDVDGTSYEVQAHVPWGTDLTVGVFTTPEKAAEFARTQCLVTR